MQEWPPPDKPTAKASLAELRAETERAQHEKRRLDAVFQALPSPMVLLDPEGRVASFNEAACRWLDLEDAQPESGARGDPVRCASSIGRSVEILLPWVAPALERLRQGARDGQSVLTERGQPERLSFLDTRIFPLLGPTGAFEGALVVIQDVSALRDAAETQARTASELRGQLREASCLNRMAEALGRPVDSVEELLANTAAALPQCWGAPGEVVARITFDGQSSQSSDQNVCGETMEEPLSVLGRSRGTVTLCRLGSAQGFLPGDAPLLSSITRQLEHVLETRLTLTLLGQSEKQFREFFNSAADAIFIHDPDGRILDANKNAGIWLNLPTESLTGTNLLEFVAGDDREAAAAHFVNALRGTPELFQATLTRHDGFVIPAELLCQDQDYQGQPVLVSSGRNIAGRLRAQAEIEHRLELEALVARVSGRLINTDDKGLPRAMQECLDDICRFLGLDHAGIYLKAPRAKSFTLAFQRHDKGQCAVTTLLGRIGSRKLPWLTERLLAGERVFIRNAAHMPPAAHRERELLTRAGILSLTAMPMTVKDRLLGVLVVFSDRPQESAKLAGSRLLDQVALLLSNAILRRRASAALRESESLAHAILDALPANICVLDKKGVLTMVNGSWGAFGPESLPFDGERGRLDVGGNYLEACRADADNPNAAKALAGIQSVLAGKTASFVLEYPGRLDGLQRWYLMQVTPFARGKSGAVVSHRDITARTSAVLELRESEERFRLIVETAQEAVVKIDSTGRITYANPRAQALFGYSQDELLTRAVQDILDPLDHELLQQKLELRRQGFADRYELRFRNKNGHLIWTMVSASPLRNSAGEITGSIGMITDISDRVRTEIRLRRNEARYRSLVESMHEGLIMTRHGGVISYVNAQFCAMLGRKRHELTGHQASEFAEQGSKERLAQMLSGALPGATPDTIPGTIPDAHSGGGPEEILWEHVSGRHIYSLVSPSSFADETGKMAGFFAVITDTTERKGLESQLLQSQKLEAIGQLAAGIAHEINTPTQYVGNNVQFLRGAFADMLDVLGAVRQLTQAAKTACPTQADIAALEQLMAERDIEFLSAEVPGAVAQTLEGVERISTIVRSVKQFAHPGAGLMAPANLNESMQSTATVSRNEWKYVAELTLDLDPELPPVVCMIGEINQVVLNLIINAAHAIADAKKLDPERAGRITLSTRMSPPWAEIRVADTGTGIPKSAQDKIFNPFFTTKEVGRGTGQGLTISRSIMVDKHKGQLFFETEEGRGTTFVVRLPLEPAE